MNSRGGKSIGLRPVRPYRRMCRIVRRTTEGDSIWSSSSFDERDRISKQFAEENEKRIEEGRRIVRALSIAERVVTFRGGEIKLQNIRPGTRDGPRAKQSSRLRIEIISKGEEEREERERRGKAREELARGAQPRRQSERGGVNGR